MWAQTRGESLGWFFAHHQASPTRLWYAGRTLVLISETGSDGGGAYRTEGNGRYSRATRQPSRRATQRTYAYHLVDHLRWVAVNGYREDSITIQNLLRYLALCGTQHYGPMGTPWRASPLGESAQAVRAACLKGYYLDLTTRENVNAELRTALSTRRLPHGSNRNRSMLGHLTLSMAANPLSSGAPPRKHP